MLEPFSADKPVALFIFYPLDYDNTNNLGMCAFQSWHASKEDALASLPTDVEEFAIAQIANFATGDLTTSATDGVSDNSDTAIWDENYGDRNESRENLQEID